VTVLTGAGVSAESGIPTFRGKDGLWNNFNAEELATPEAFNKDPLLVWRWYDYRRNIIASANPNDGHIALAKMEQLYGEQFLLISQNVDGLHSKAGSKNLLELHGNIWQGRCLNCKAKINLSNKLKKLPPRCSFCAGMLRPDIVWFGESLDHNIMNSALGSLQKCNILLVVGSSSIVEPAASFGRIAKGAGALLVEINIEPSAISSTVDYFLLGESGKILPTIIRELNR
ncbi:MAG: SIR2 family NAD-dependent protein deacylase, partial [Nitrospinota bacterium]